MCRIQDDRLLVLADQPIFSAFQCALDDAKQAFDDFYAYALNKNRYVGRYFLAIVL